MYANPIHFFLLNIDANPLCRPLPPLAHTPNSVLKDIDVNPYWHLLPRPLHIPLSILINIDANPIWRLPSPSSTQSLFNCC